LLRNQRTCTSTVRGRRRAPYPRRDRELSARIRPAWVRREDAQELELLGAQVEPGCPTVGPRVRRGRVSVSSLTVTQRNTGRGRARLLEEGQASAERRGYGSVTASASSAPARRASRPAGPIADQWADEHGRAAWSAVGAHRGATSMSAGPAGGVATLATRGPHQTGAGPRRAAGSVVVCMVARADGLPAGATATAPAPPTARARWEATIVIGETVRGSTLNDSFDASVNVVFALPPGYGMGGSPPSVFRWYRFTPRARERPNPVPRSGDGPKRTGSEGRIRMKQEGRASATG
jgi:hypothetical protein